MDELPPVITSVQNRRVQEVRRWVAHTRDAREAGVLIADGAHLVREAFAADLPCRGLFIQDDARSPEIHALRDEAVARGCEVHATTSRVFALLSPVQTPSGLLGVFARPRASAEEIWGDLERGGGHVAIAHGIQDPANLGSIARSARAAGIRALFVCGASVDPFHPRALRAAMGASFRLPLSTELSFPEAVEGLKHRGYRVAALDPRGDTTLATLSSPTRFALVLGSEGRGLPTDVAPLCDLTVRIPMAPDVESLGVAAAAAIAFFHLARAGEL